MLGLEDKWWKYVNVCGEYDCWEWLGAIKDKGYGTWGNQLVHRLSWQKHKGPIPYKKHVLHYCDNRPCCNPKHLFIGTQLINVRDMYSKGRSAFQTGTHKNYAGEKAPRALLTREQVDAIRKEYCPTITQKELAAKYGVSRKTISNIICEKCYK